MKTAALLFVGALLGGVFGILGLSVDDNLYYGGSVLLHIVIWAIAIWLFFRSTTSKKNSQQNQSSDSNSQNSDSAVDTHTRYSQSTGGDISRNKQRPTNEEGQTQEGSTSSRLASYIAEPTGEADQNDLDRWNWRQGENTDSSIAPQQPLGRTRDENQTGSDNLDIPPFLYPKFKDTSGQGNDQGNLGYRLHTQEGGSR